MLNAALIAPILVLTLVIYVLLLVGPNKRNDLNIKCLEIN